jgi:hypothetical protein
VQLDPSLDSLCLCKTLTGPVTALLLPTLQALRGPQLALALPQKWKQVTFASADENIAQLEEQAKERQALLIDTLLHDVPCLHRQQSMVYSQRAKQCSSTHC